MRFLHLSDLHLGKQLNDLSLLPDQEVILTQIADIAQREAVDAVLIAGDVYQRSTPQAEAMALFDRFLTQLAGQGRRVFVISGNHDSAQRVAYLSSLIRGAGVYVSEVFDGQMQHYTLQDRYGDVTVWLLPFIRPSQVRRFYPEETIACYQDAVAAVIRHAPMDPGARNLLVCHQFLTGCETSDSEERTVGGLDHIDASVLDDFDYVALGHIHKPQRVKRDTVRYAGTPLKYSFSEAGHRKSVCVVDVLEKGNVQYHTVPLQPLRDVRLIEGTMEEILRMPYSEDYVWITIHDELVPPDARISLTVNFPNMLKFSVVNAKTRQDMDISAEERMEKQSIDALFMDFYRLQNNGQTPSEAHLRVLRQVIAEMEEAE